MPEYIAIESAGIKEQLGGLSSAAHTLTGQEKKVEITGSVPSMESFLETYAKIAQLITGYKNLLSKDATNIRASITAIQQREEEAAQSIK